MNKYIVTATVVLSLAPGLALAGEGNGPDFPGLQVPNVSVGNSAQPGGEGIVTETVSHRADSGVEPASGFPSRVTPDGIVRPGRNRTQAAPRSMAAMPAAPRG